ncbi:LWR-salt protein [Natronosalvus halobius]|uniref:LWR-salt protein n=1 Tax=Natronosalvus halobius TaxID=2953746 RepID=UPI0020A14FA3|nr:LWR-salt protein [Natronosalvus halobius]USZ70656.1 LWR-salt protein [Natronosalvus halobius]
MEAHYAFLVEARLTPVDPGLTIDSPVVERRCLLAAPEPGDQGWRLFRDLLWRGELGDERHARALIAEKLGQPVEAVEFRAFYADEPYLEALKSAIGDDLESFKADDVTEVLSKYFGSSLEVGVDPMGGPDGSGRSDAD